MDRKCIKTWAEAVRRHFRHYWRKTDAEKVEVMKAFYAEVAKKPIKVELDKEMAQRTGGGCYNKMTERITMFSTSLMTLLHEIGHEIDKGMNGEAPAVTFSHKVFSTAYPRMYARSRDSGKFFHKPNI